MNTSDLSTPEKIRASIEAALADTEVFIHLNGTLNGVVLPKSLAGQPNVTLKISHHYSGPLKLEPDKIVTDLTFPEGRFACHVPYEAIFGMTSLSGESTLWPDNAPLELLTAIGKESIKKSTAEQSEAASKNPNSQTNKINHLSPISNTNNSNKTDPKKSDKKSSPAKLTRIK